MNVQIEVASPKESIRLLLSEIIDYAGLFPPAMLSMTDAVANYSSYRKSVFSWMLGRFIVPAARLGEFLESASDHFENDTENVWRLSVLAGEDIDETIRTVNYFNEKNSSAVVCDSLEVKANTESKIENTVKALPANITAFFEIATDERLADLVSMLAVTNQRAKIRTGGVTRKDFPSAKEIVRFVRTCMAANVPFKATAGLHHPLRCFKPLTYAPDAPQGTMHGFLNMLIMTAFLREGFRASVLEEIMEDEFEEVFQFDDNGIRWREDHFLPASQLGRLRKMGMTSFGSCSFDEPIADLRSLGLL